MLRLVLRRVLVQRRLMAAVLVLLAGAASLVGVCSLLLGVTQDRAFAEEIQQSRPRDVDVDAYLVGLSGADLEDARARAATVVSDILAPTDPTVTATATGRMRQLDRTDRTDRTDLLAYLVTDQGLDQRADLTSGQWPAETAVGPTGAAVPETTARLLGLGLGDKVRLGTEVGLDGVDSSITVVVVGIFRPRSRTGWETDPLSGDGFDPAYSDGTASAPAYGPFAVTDRAFLATGSSVAALRVTAHPTLSLADESALRTAVGSLDEASALLSSRVGEAAHITRVGSELPETMSRVQAQQSTTRATVLVVLLLGMALSLAAALLAGRLIASVREDERELLVAFGLSRRQQLGAALAEAALLATTAALLAVPAAAVAHSGLTRLPDLEAANLTQPPTVTRGLVLSVLASLVLLSAVLVAAAQADRPAPDPTARRWTLTRSGLDVLLLAVVAVGWWQLRMPATSASSGDATRTIAPVLCLAAATVLVVRLVPLLLAAVARSALRLRSLVLPLAVQQAARRPHSGTAMVLVAAAVATSVFGLALRTTWGRSQDDQATLRVGTDLSFVPFAPMSPPEAAAVTAVTATVVDAARGGTSTPEPVLSVAVERPLALGRFVGSAGSRPVLIAVDTRHAGALLRGRLDGGRTWAEVGSRLAPGAPVRGLELSRDGAGVELEGSAAGVGDALTVTPTAVVQDAGGLRRSVAADPVPLDGRPHQVEWVEPVGSGMRLVGLRLDLGANPGADLGSETTAELSVAVRVPGRGAPDPSWQVQSLVRDGPASGTVVSVDHAGADTEVLTTATVDLTYLPYTGDSLLATAFPTPPEVPVAVSQDLADAIDAVVGGELSAIVDGTALALRVTAIVPTVPSAPGQVAVLADVDTLSRALVAGGSLDPVVDGWWVGHPTAETAEELRALKLGEVVTREEVATQLVQGPLSVSAPAALLALVLSAVLMLLAGVVLVLSAERQRRSLDVARLLALGLSRQGARRLLVAEHGTFFVPLVLAGALVGAAAAALIGPHLIRSDVGANPVPDAVLAWPWTTEVALLGGLVLGTLVITSLMTARHVRRADPAFLGVGDT